MIPPFDSTGNLPPGVHEAEWDEFVARFGTTAERQELLAGLRDVMTLLAAAGCRRIYINGSFVTSKLEPGDFDACWDLQGVDLVLLGQLDPLILRFADRRELLKAKFGGDLFPVQESRHGGEQSFFEFFQRDKVTLRPKGIVALDPRRLP